MPIYKHGNAFKQSQSDEFDKIYTPGTHAVFGRLPLYGLRI